MSVNNIMNKVNHIAAWVLFFVVIAYVITGFGMTKGFISPNLSRALHLGWLGGIGLLAFIFHTYWSIHFSFIRYNIWNKTTNILLILFYILLVGLFIWLQFFFNPHVVDKSSTTTFSNYSQTNSPVSTTIFTTTTLAKYNGKNGAPAYVAIDGVVYDMSKEFRNGNHHGYFAGQDLSAAFHQQHPNNYLDNLSVVGKYQTN